MHFLTALSLKNRALIALVTVVAAVFGLLGMGSLKQELMPSVQFPAIAVVTTYPGASPEVVNNDVSGPIETALRGVPQLEQTTATSSTGSSMVVAQFTYGVDLAVTEQKVERAISRISQLLPQSADTQVLSGSIDDFPVIQIAVTPKQGQDPEDTARLVERVAIPELSDLDGVRDAQLSGARGERITITPNDEELAARGLSAQSITDALQQSGVLIAAGTVSDGDRTLAVQAGSALHSVDEISALPIAVSPSLQGASAAQQGNAQAGASGAGAADAGAAGSGSASAGAAGAGSPQGAGSADAAASQEQGGAQAQAGGSALQQTVAPEPQQPATIGEVATVALEANPVQSISRVDGEPALTIGVTKMSAANTVDVSHAVQQKLDDLQDKLDGAKLSVIFDQAPYVERSIESLTTEGLLGLVFAVLVILVFLMSVRATLVTAISIPTSVLLAFIGLNFAEFTLNMLTLGALTISIGRVVDDSIVVIENIKRHLGENPTADRVATIVEAVREVAGAITASTVTTVAVFLPMAFVSGMVGELFRPFAFTVTIALVASLLVALTIVPVLAYWFLRPDRVRRRKAARGADPAVGDDAAEGADVASSAAASGAGAGRVSAAEEPAGERVTALQRGYRPVIEWTLKRPAITLIIAVVVFGATVAASPLMKTNFLGSDEQNSVGLTQALPPGTSLEAQLAQVERVEDALKDVKAVETVQVTIGSGGSGVGAILGGGGDGTVSYSLTTDPDADQAEAQDDIRAAVDRLKDAGDFSIGQSGGGVTASSAIEINVTAPDQETLAKGSDAIVAQLKKQPGLEQIESDLGTSRPFLSISVDRMKAAEAGLSEAAVSSLVAQRMQPTQIGQIAIDANTVRIYLAQPDVPADVAAVAAMQIPTMLGEKRLDELATVEVADGPVTVRTQDNVRMVTVSALPKGDNLATAGTEVQEALDAAKLPAGATASIGGVMSQQSEAFGQLGLALLAAILIVYVVMVATFRSLLQPLLLLVSVPFAATGAILLLIATGIPLGVASLIGVLMLIGIVVTNAIVLIDLVNQYRARGDGLRDAVLHGSSHRLRPIVMTALATILALTPMALGVTGQGGFISQPLAVVVIGGLLTSTVLTLVVLPTLYFIVERGRERRADRRASRRPAVAGAVSGLSTAHAAHPAHAAPGALAAEPVAPVEASPVEPAAEGEASAEAETDAVESAEPDSEDSSSAILRSRSGSQDLGPVDAPAPSIADAEHAPEAPEAEEPAEAEGPAEAEPEPHRSEQPEAEVPVTTAQLNWERMLWEASREDEEEAHTPDAASTADPAAADAAEAESAGEDGTGGVGADGDERPSGPRGGA